MMNSGKILEEISGRRSFRAMSTREIDRKALDRIIKAAGLAPSCFNKQPWRYILVQSESGREKIHQGLKENNSWAKKAPAYIMVVTAEHLDCEIPDGRHYAEFDTGMSVFSLLIQAWSEGIIAHPIAGYSQNVIKQAFDIPDEMKLLTVLILGYKDSGAESGLTPKQLESERGPRVRNPSADWFCEEKWDF